MIAPLAIHHREASFSGRWIDYCVENGVPFERVDCFATDIIDQLKDKSALLWHFSHGFSQDIMFARFILQSAQMMGLEVFPDHNTCWHFDDKIAQKYLLESIGAPLVATHVFYKESDALDWILETSFPKVFKLRRGSGSRNVRLVRSASEAESLVRKAFGRGFRGSGTPSQETWKLRESWRKKQLGAFLASLPAKIARRRRLDTGLGREKGYLYFQDFMPYNSYDTRVTVIGERAFGYTREALPGDFRASGSGRIVYDLDRVNMDCIETAFSIARRLKSQSICFDFVKDELGKARVLEMSYGFPPDRIYNCPGHWDANMNWVQGQIWPEHAIIQDMLGQIRRA